MRVSGSVAQQLLLLPSAVRTNTAAGRPGDGGRAPSHLRHAADHPPVAAPTVRISGQPQANPAFDAPNPPAQAGQTAQMRTTNSQHPFFRYPNLVQGLEITHPDQVWVSDITYIRLHNEFVYLAIILDVFTRSIRGWCLSRTIDLQLTLDALRMALEQHDPPQIHHSDQGLQYAAHTYVNLLQAHNVQISMAAVGKAEENGFAERFMRTIKEEEVDLSEYHDFADAQTQIGHFIQAVYNHKRIHSALDYFTPSEFELAWRLARTLTAPPSP